MRYMPGRKYERATESKRKTKSSISHLREKRIGGVPSSFRKLNFFLKERVLDMTDFVRETCEKKFEEEAEMVGDLPEDEMDIEDDGEEVELELQHDQLLGPSEDDEEYSDGDQDD